MSCPPTTIAELIETCRADGLEPDRLAIISLGANLPSKAGSARETVQMAAQRLTRLSRWPLVMSSIIVTEPVDCPPGSPSFCNAVVVLDPGASTPEQLLIELQRIEDDFGRRRSGERNEARVLDLDLIACGKQRRDGPRLTLPHPRAAERAFVLEPLAEIWPEYRLPGVDTAS